MRRTPFYNFFIVALLVTMTASVSAQQVDSKLPWSVRLTESEMIRYPESWQLDFQPKLKWDYCHGLELGAMLDMGHTEAHAVQFRQREPSSAQNGSE